MSTKEEITIEVIRGDNPLSPPAASADASEELVDEFVQALERPATPAIAPLKEELDLGFEYSDPTGIVQGLPPIQGLAHPEPAPPAAEDSHARIQVPASVIAMAQAEAEREDTPPAEAEAKAAEVAEAPANDRAAASKRAPRNVQERIRGLTAAEQQKLARCGEQRERVVLERMYGKNVWEALLRNPKLTPPEAARIARMGALPQPLLELIVANRAWLSSAQVRRALLANPRLKKDMVSTVLRATPKNELKLMPKQTAYPVTVRQIATKMLK